MQKRVGAPVGNGQQLAVPIEHSNRSRLGGRRVQKLTR